MTLIHILIFSLPYLLLYVFVLRRRRYKKSQVRCAGCFVHLCGAGITAITIHGVLAGISGVSHPDRFMISPELSPKLIANQGEVVTYWRDNYLQRTAEYDFALFGLPRYHFMEYKIKIPEGNQQTFIKTYIQNATENGWTVEQISKDDWLKKNAEGFYETLPTQDKERLPYEAFLEKLSTYWQVDLSKPVKAADEDNYFLDVLLPNFKVRVLRTNPLIQGIQHIDIVKADYRIVTLRKFSGDADSSITGQDAALLIYTKDNEAYIECHAEKWFNR